MYSVLVACFWYGAVHKSQAFWCAVHTLRHFGVLCTPPGILVCTAHCPGTFGVHCTPPVNSACSATLSVVGVWNSMSSIKCRCAWHTYITAHHAFGVQSTPNVGWCAAFQVVCTHFGVLNTPHFLQCTKKRAHRQDETEQQCAQTWKEPRYLSTTVTFGSVSTTPVHSTLSFSCRTLH